MGNKDKKDWKDDARKKLGRPQETGRMNQDGTPEKKRGRKQRILSDEQKELLRRAAGLGMSPTQLGAILGIPHKTFIRMYQRDEEIRQIVSEAAANKILMVGSRAFERALEDDAMTRYYLDKMGGWGQQDTILVQQNNTTISPEVQEKVEFYKNLSPEDLHQMALLSGESSDSDIVTEVIDRANKDEIDHAFVKNMNPEHADDIPGPKIDGATIEAVAKDLNTQGTIDPQMDRFIGAIPHKDMLKPLTSFFDARLAFVPIDPDKDLKDQPRMTDARVRLLLKHHDLKKYFKVLRIALMEAGVLHKRVEDPENPEKRVWCFIGLAEQGINKYKQSRTKREIPQDDAYF